VPQIGRGIADIAPLGNLPDVHRSLWALNESKHKVIAQLGVRRACHCRF
jgi:hypothetical protein